MLGLARHRYLTSERGAAMVLFAIVLPLILAFGSAVITVGNWWVHKRHLQTQVDAAALAPAPEFVGCFFAPAAAEQAIALSALEYAGDTLRDPSPATPYNTQVQQPDDVRAVLNSSSYWSQANGMDPNAPSAGYGLDYSLGTPCATKSLDVKATDDEAPTLWGWLPFIASPKTHAKVEIRRLRSTTGMLPLAVPEVDPQAVAAIFVNELNGNVIAALELIEGNCPDPDGGGPQPPYPYKCWAVDFPSVLINADNIGVVVLVSRDNPDPPLNMPTLTQICGQDPGFVICYAGDGNEDGLSFIHGYDGGGNPTPQNPIPRDVELVDAGCTGDHSAPYFLLNGDCDVLIQAVIDFGVNGNPTGMPTCARVSSSPGGTMTWSAGGLGGSLGTWTTTISLVAASGRNRVDLSTSVKRPNGNNCNQQTSSNPLPKVAAPYVADDNSGPVQYLTVENLAPPFGLANSTEKESIPRPIRVTVGLQRPLNAQQDAREPPILLRLGSNPSSQTQALDCDGSTVQGPSGSHSNFRNEFIDGCMTPYEVNYDDWSTPPDDTFEWADIDCSQYPFGNQPPPTIDNDPMPNCIAIQTGVSAGQFQQALQDRFATPCTPNNWPDSTATDQEVYDFFLNYDFTNDPRYVTLVIADFTAFLGQGSSEPRPLKLYGGFYYTGSGSVSCPGDDPHPLGVTGQRARFDMWGYFVNIVEFSGAGTPSETLCTFGEDPSVCIAVLVE